MFGFSRKAHRFRVFSIDPVASLKLPRYVFHQGQLKTFRLAYRPRPYIPFTTTLIELHR
jgi:hypothetical protein